MGVDGPWWVLMYIGIITSIGIGMKKGLGPGMVKWRDIDYSYID